VGGDAQREDAGDDEGDHPEDELAGAPRVVGGGLEGLAGERAGAGDAQGRHEERERVWHG
jgi:hypothetical protein